MESNNRPVVHTKDGVYIRDKGLVTKDLSQPGFVPPKVVQPQVEEGGVSRFDCMHKPKD
jgi:hypothetical protein